VVGELFRLLKDANESFEAMARRMPPQYIAAVLEMLQKKTITRTVAKQVFEECYQTGENPTQIVSNKGLTQISDEDTIINLAREVIANNPKPVEQYRSGKSSAIQFLVGQVMKATRGQANPQVVRSVLEDELG
jgi:aspartyl-tRNA(Asn)/glutamyl-tRNA(Gln) amidotransferase subunit B